MKSCCFCWRRLRGAAGLPVGIDAGRALATPPGRRASRRARVGDDAEQLIDLFLGEVGIGCGGDGHELRDELDLLAEVDVELVVGRDIPSENPALSLCARSPQTCRPAG